MYFFFVVFFFISNVHITFLLYLVLANKCKNFLHCTFYLPAVRPYACEGKFYHSSYQPRKWNNLCIWTLILTVWCKNSVHTSFLGWPRYLGVQTVTKNRNSNFCICNWLFLPKTTRIHSRVHSFHVVLGTVHYIFAKWPYCNYSCLDLVTRTFLFLTE